MGKGAQEQRHNTTEGERNRAYMRYGLPNPGKGRGREFSGDHWLLGKGAQEQLHTTTEGEQIRAYMGYGLPNPGKGRGRRPRAYTTNTSHGDMIWGYGDMSHGEGEGEGQGSDTTCTRGDTRTHDDHGEVWHGQLDWSH